MRKAASDSASVDDLAPAHQAHLAHVDEAVGHVSFRHLLVRAAIVHRASLSERGSAHHSPVAALTESPEPRVWHLVESATGPDRTGRWPGSWTRRPSPLGGAAHRPGPGPGRRTRRPSSTGGASPRPLRLPGAYGPVTQPASGRAIPPTGRGRLPREHRRSPRSATLVGRSRTGPRHADRAGLRRHRPPPHPRRGRCRCRPTAFGPGARRPTPPRTTTGTTAASCSAAARQPLHPQSRAVAVSRHRDGPVRTGSSDPVQAVPPCASGPCGGWRRRLGRLRLARPSSTGAAVTAVL